MRAIAENIVVGALLFCGLVLPVSASAAAAPSIFLDAPPDRIMVGERYAFYARVRNTSARPIPFAIEFTVRDNSIALDDVGVAREPNEGASIARRPQSPRTTTDFRTESTAICGWGELPSGEVASCAFYVTAKTATTAKIPFAIVARDIGSGATLASHRFEYRVAPGIYTTKSLQDYDYRIRSACADLSDRGAWTQAYGECYKQRAKTLGVPAFPISGMTADPRQSDPPVR
jgi:hypothetical protein